MDVEKILEERKKEYGSFEKQVETIRNIMNELRSLRFEKTQNHNEWLSILDIENFFLVLKLCRWQTFKDEDTITDLIGYAKLIKDSNF